MRRPRPAPLPRYWKREYDWVFAHYPELARRYPNQWIAFARGKVLAHGKSLMPVLQRAHRQTDLPEVPHLFVEQGIHVYAHARPA